MAMCFILDVFTVVLKWKEYRSVDYITIESHESGCIIVAVPFFIVETIIHPKKKTLFDRYTISPFELDIPAEAVTFPPLCRDYKVSGWYIVRVQGDILLCVASVFTYVDTPKTTGDTRNVIYATEHFLFLHYT